MNNSGEFILGLTEHRILGYIFQAFFIEKNGELYEKTLLREKNADNHSLNSNQQKLLRLTEFLSEESLTKKFSKSAKNLQSLVDEQGQAFFAKHMVPYIERNVLQIINLLMNGDIRLFLRHPKYAAVYEEDMIAVPRSFTDCCFNFNRSVDGTSYCLDLIHDGEKLAMLNRKIMVLTNNPCAFVMDRKLYVFNKLDIKKILPFLEKESIFIPKDFEYKYFSGFVMNTVKGFPVKHDGFTITHDTPERKVILSLEYNLMGEPVFYPLFSYGEKELVPGEASLSIVTLSRKQNSYHFSITERDIKWEKNQLKLLKTKGLRENNGGYSCNSDGKADNNEKLYSMIQWTNNHNEELHNDGFIVREKLQKKFSLAKPELEVKIQETNDWFDLYATVRFGSYTFPFLKLKNHILNDIKEYALPDGTIAIIPDEWFTQYKDLFPFISENGNKLSLRKHHYNLLKRSIEGIDKEFFTRLGLIEHRDMHDVKLPDTLGASLRRYQQEGLNWLWHLHSHRFGGCLADDMGLGKTLQTLTLLLKAKQYIDNGAENPLESGNKAQSGSAAQHASLIVVPPSLVHNWENEIRKFTPSLRTYRHTGLLREKTEMFEQLTGQYDIIITTYGTIRMDAQLMESFEFFYIILDESHYIKNPESKTYQAVNRLRSKYRLTLTGTPIENSLSDLWAQLNFLNKGILGNLIYFRYNFIIPIEKRNDREQQQKLQKLISPFILRRTKEEVLKDLPPLTEQIRYCSMSPSQQHIYETEKSAIRREIIGLMEEGDRRGTLFQVFRGLTRLRQLANHPSLINDKGPEDDSDDHDSGKFGEILSALESLVEENHKVLVFSSFVKHLELVRKQLVEKNRKYAMLTGKTKHREEEIKKFLDDPENHIFLISLKAGGVGLNLTAADYVFIIDPWWNPAAENQAVSRAYRMGQDKKVFVYRFITENSIEEKIQILQERKSQLADKFVNANNTAGELTKEDIMELLG